MTNKSLAIILAVIIFFLLTMLTISTILNNHLFNVVVDLRARLDYKEAVLKVYETNQAQIEACDRQTWGDADPYEAFPGVDTLLEIWGDDTTVYIRDNKGYFKKQPDTLDTMEVR
jgi:hypothetical protein